MRNQPERLFVVKLQWCVHVCFTCVSCLFHVCFTFASCLLSLSFLGVELVVSCIHVFLMFTSFLLHVRSCLLHVLCLFHVCEALKEGTRGIGEKGLFYSEHLIIQKTSEDLRRPNNKLS